MVNANKLGGLCYRLSHNGRLSGRLTYSTREGCEGKLVFFSLVMFHISTKSYSAKPAKFKYDFVEGSGKVGTFGSGDNYLQCMAAPYSASGVAEFETAKDYSAPQGKIEAWAEVLVGYNTVLKSDVAKMDFRNEQARVSVEFKNFKPVSVTLTKVEQA